MRCTADDGGGAEDELVHRGIEEVRRLQRKVQAQGVLVFVLFNVIIGVALSILDALIGTYDSSTGLGLLNSVYGLAVLVPSLAVSVRRLHDIDRTGWWVLIALVPVVGAIVLIVFHVLDSTPGPNRYGPNPKAAGVA